MAEKNKVDAIRHYASLIQRQSGRVVRPYRADGYMNLLTKYGTHKDLSENYEYIPEGPVADDILTQFYEGNGLFARIIDTPAEEAIKNGFTLQDITDEKIINFCTEALEELDWEEVATTGVKWARLYGGSIAVMLINDGRGLEEPLDWKHIKSIDDIVVYDRSMIQPDYSTMLSYDPDDPFGTRGSRLGMPEYYDVFTREGAFRVHDSRCLIFKNGLLPMNSTNQTYQMWGMPEYIRIKRAIKDAEIAHGTAPKMLDRSVQAIYRMKDLSAELATEEGENRVLKRMQLIDMARGLVNSIVIDEEGEDYDFKTFSYTGVSEVIDTTCNFLSALTCIPQTILFGRSPAGMNATGVSDLENWYNYLERIQKRMLKSNLRYLLSVVFQAGLLTGEIDEIPPIKVEFNPLWSLSEQDQVALEQAKATVQQTKAATANMYVQMQVLDPTEVRKKLADSEEFDIDTVLDDYTDEELFENMPKEQPQDMMGGMMGGMMPNAEGGEAVNNEKNQDVSGNGPASAPAATKLPQDMSHKEKETAQEAKEELSEPPQNRSKTPEIDEEEKKHKLRTDDGQPDSVGILVMKDGKVLTGTRRSGDSIGQICGPGGHIEKGETPGQAAIRETQEEFGITPTELIPLGRSGKESNGHRPQLFLCVRYEGNPECTSDEMSQPVFKTIEELENREDLFEPFRNSIEDLKNTIKKKIRTDAQVAEWITVNGNRIPLDKDGDPVGGNMKALGVKGSGKKFSDALKNQRKKFPERASVANVRKQIYNVKDSSKKDYTLGSILKKAPVGTGIKTNGKSFFKMSNNGKVNWAFNDKDGKTQIFNDFEMLNAVIDTINYIQVYDYNAEMQARNAAYAEINGTEGIKTPEGTQTPAQGGTTTTVATDGGPGSGNWGHEGRPGKVGGSEEGGGAHNREGSKKKGFTSFAKKRVEMAQNQPMSYEKMYDVPEGSVFISTDGQRLKKISWNAFMDEKTGEIKDLIDMKKYTEGRFAIPRTSSTNYKKLPSYANKDVGKEDQYTEKRKKSAKIFTSIHDEKEIDAELREHSGEIYQTFNTETKQAFDSYTGSDYGDINSALRYYDEKDEGEKSSYARYEKLSTRNKRDIDLMTTALSESTLGRDVTLYRGTNQWVASRMFGIDSKDWAKMSPEDLQKALVGKVGTDYGFMSCGTMEGTGFTYEDVKFEIYAPDGTNAIYAEPFSALGAGSGMGWDGKEKQVMFSDEFETLLQRGTSILVTAVEGTYYNCTIKCEIVAQEPEPLKFTHKTKVSPEQRKKNSEAKAKEDKKMQAIKDGSILDIVDKDLDNELDDIDWENEFDGFF